MATLLPDIRGRRRLKTLIRAYAVYALRGSAPRENWAATRAQYNCALERMLEHLDQRALEIVDLSGRLESAEAKLARVEDLLKKALDAPKKVQ